jgi:hypothetical protein
MVIKPIYLSEFNMKATSIGLFETIGLLISSIGQAASTVNNTAYAANQGTSHLPDAADALGESISLAAKLMAQESKAALIESIPPKK